MALKALDEQMTATSHLGELRAGLELVLNSGPFGEHEHWLNPLLDMDFVLELSLMHLIDPAPIWHL